MKHREKLRQEGGHQLWLPSSLRLKQGDYEP
jgi:hypothetical protein